MAILRMASVEVLTAEWVSYSDNLVLRSGNRLANTWFCLLRGNRAQAARTERQPKIVRRLARAFATEQNGEERVIFILPESCRSSMPLRLNSR